jgi:hypothetical protein
MEEEAMTKMKYALERGGDKPLEISWKGNYKNVEVRLKGNLIGEILSKKELFTGQIFQLPDGTTLKVQLTRTWGMKELLLLRNDKPLPGSASDPVFMNTQSSGSIYFIAGANIVLGLFAYFSKIEFMQTLGISIFSVAIGFIFLVLGFFTQRRSRLALMVALIIYSLDCALALFSATPFVLSFVPVLNNIVKPGTSWILKFVYEGSELLGEMTVMATLLFIAIFLRFYFLRAMAQGIGAIREIKKETPATVS